MKTKSRGIRTAKLLTIALFSLIAIVGLSKVSSTDGKVSASAAGPSPSHTSAPGEANCTACHGDFPVNSGTGNVTISGVPAYYRPNQNYPITVTASQVDAVIYGFQLVAVDGTGANGGEFTLPTQTPPQTQIVHGLVEGVLRSYVEHTVDGIIPTQFGSKTWTFTWRSPAQRKGKIGFYAAGNGANSDGSTSGDYIYTSAKAALSGSLFDFDGDGMSDVGIYRPSLGEWWIYRSSTGSAVAAQFGASTDAIVPADYTGDGKSDVAFWRPSTGEWFVLRSEDNSFFSFPFGSSGDVPASADFDSDGKADPTVFRPSTGTWFIQRSTAGTLIQQFGANGDQPIAADYDGDGKADLAIYRPAAGEWWINRSTAGTIAFGFGNSTDRIVPGDYTGDGKADVAFWRPATGEWFILRSEDTSYYSAPFGSNGDTPSPADYDGDGKVDIAVFRPSSATWFVNRTSGGTLIQQFGTTGDRPLPSAFVR